VFTAPLRNAAHPHPFTLQGAKEALAAGASDWSESKALWIAALCGGGLALFTAVVVCPLLWKRLNERFEECAVQLCSAAPACCGCLLRPGLAIRLLQPLLTGCVGLGWSGCPHSL
jgi:hypothetical protein